MNEMESTTLDDYNIRSAEGHNDYPEYKRFGGEYLSVIPAHWKIERFRSNLGYIKGNKPVETKGSQSQVYDIPYLSMEYLRDVISSPQFANSEEDDLILADDGDVLLLWDGSKAGEFVMAKKGVVSSTMSKIFLRKENNINYIYYQLKTIEEFLQNTTVGMGIPHVNPQILKNIKLAIPPKEEQEAIVDFLDKNIENIDKLINEKEELIRLLKEKRSAIITERVTKGLDSEVDVQETEAEWLGSVPEHWDINIFRRFCSLNQGLQIAQSERFDNPGEARYKYLTVEDINADEDYNSDYIEDPPENVICNKDDVLLARTGATGEVISNFHGAFHNNFFKINFDRDRIEKDFLVYYLSNELIKEHLLAKAGLTTVPDLNHRYFLDTTILLPPKKEQKEIVEYLDEEIEGYEDSIKKIEEGIERLKEYRTALITNAVTGQIDVRGEV